VLSSAAALMEIRAQAERDSGVGLKLFGFIADSVFTFIPEYCSRSSRNSVRNHPGIAFTFPRIPQAHAWSRRMNRNRVTINWKFTRTAARPPKVIKENRSRRHRPG
jgi:hypothetical protein